MESKKDFRVEVRTKIVRCKISIAKLSRLADLNSGTIYKWLRGESSITSPNLEKIFNVLDNLK